MKILSLLLLVFVSGCMSEAKIERIVATCPQYVQDNVGEIKYMPISWGTAMGFGGVTDKYTGEIWLTLWANEWMVLHEVAHSVHIRTPHRVFDRQFKEAKGFISLYALNHAEAVAEAFVEGMGGRTNEKIDLTMKFMRGE